MKPKNFDSLVDQVFQDCKKLLATKKIEYSEESDRLIQFKTGEVFTGLPPHRVLAGMMVKHTTSLYDMLRESDTTKHTMKQWDEKIFDHINYLFLLCGILEENQKLKQIQLGEKNE